MTIKELLRSQNIVNTHDMLKRFAVEGKDVALMYYRPDYRDCSGCRTQVYSPSHKTDPNSHWHDYGSKSFSGGRKQSMPQAMAWASAKYGISSWVPCPTCRTTLIPREVRESAMKFVANLKRSRPN